MKIISNLGLSRDIIYQFRLYKLNTLLYIVCPRESRFVDPTPTFYTTHISPNTSYTVCLTSSYVISPNT